MPTGPRPATALALLLAINLFNYLDRQVLSALLPRIEQKFNVSKAEIGVAASVFLVSYMLASPIFGWLGDRMSRWWLIAIGVIVWSLASGGTGLATTFGILLLTRAIIGVGEGAYGPIAPTVIADLYPVEKRGAKLAWFYVAIPVGSALGYLLGSQFAAPDRDWRWAFFLVVPPGIILGLLCLLMREPMRGAADGTAHRHATMADYLGLVKIPSFVFCTIGMTAMTFTLGGVAVWIPTYFYERESVYVMSTAAIDQLADPPPVALRDKLRKLEGQTFYGMESLSRELAAVTGDRSFRPYLQRIAETTRDARQSVSLEDINLYFGGIVVLTGLAATLAGGWLGDRLRKRFSGSYFLVSGIGMLIGFPAFLAAVNVPLPWGWLFVFIAVFFLFFNTGPANTIIANVTPPAVRSSAYALNILLIHMFGDVPSPPIVGWINDVASLRIGLYVLSAAILVSGIVWTWGARYLAADTARIIAAGERSASE